MIKLYIHSQPADIPYDLLGLKYDKAHRAHSFVFAFLGSLFAQITYATQTVIDITGASVSYASHTYNLNCNGPAGTMALGIILGTGSTPPQPNDYKIQTRIDHGNAAGQLAYGINAFSNPWVATPNIYAAIQRIFTNNSGAPITVTEIALYARFGLTPFYVCIARDILPAPATIQNGQAYRFIYTFCTPVG